MKKILALLLALTLAFSLSAMAFADETPTEEEKPTEPVLPKAYAMTTISAPAGTSRSYSVYQIFVADYAIDANNQEVLSNVIYGKNAKGKTVYSEVPEEVLTNIATISGSDAEKAAALAEYAALSNPIGVIGKDQAQSIEVPTGYYLIVDEGAVAEGETYSLYLVKVAGETTISPKAGTTTSDKSTSDVNDSVVNSTFAEQTTADYDIGDNIPYVLTATVASDFDNYKDGYVLNFYDTQSAGLTFNKDAEVYVNGCKITEGFTITYSDPDTEGNVKMTVAFADLKAVTYTIPASGEEKEAKTEYVKANDTITVEYTSKLNENAVIGSAGNPNTSYIEYSNNPNNNQKGTTTEKKVIVFTYEVVVNKTDGNKPLAGATFRLSKKNAETGNFEEVRVLEASPVYAESDTEKKTPISYTSDFVGVDDGIYMLEETVTPAGYNTITPIEFTIEAEHSLDGLTALTGTENAEEAKIAFTPDNEAGTLSTTIVNNSGAVLPETGGIGTTIFYIVGSVFVVAAAIVLYAKKRVQD